MPLLVVGCVGFERIPAFSDRSIQDNSNGQFLSVLIRETVALICHVMASRAASYVRNLVLHLTVWLYLVRWGALLIVRIFPSQRLNKLERASRSSLIHG